MTGVAGYGAPLGLNGSCRWTVSLWACALGIGQVAWWPRLPGSADLASVALWVLLALALFTVLAGGGASTGRHWRPLLIRLLLPFALGSCWALKFNHQSLEQRLPADLHGTDHDVTLQVVSLPQSGPAVSYFGRSSSSSSGYLDAKFRARIVDASDPRFLHRDLELGWYRMAPSDAARLRAGSRWQMRVRLKQPRGSVNPYTFDYEAWLLEQGIFATGYVRERERPPEFIAPGRGLSTLRERIRDRLGSTSTAGGGGEVYRYSGLFRALLLGDRGGVDGDTRLLLQRTGTAHLLAISGLHVGMIAGFFFLIGSVLSRTIGALRASAGVGSAARLLRAGARGHPLFLGGLIALLGAAAYTLVSGAPLSAQRALLMTGIGICALLFRRRVGGQLAFAAALCGVLLWQPLAVLSAGFWLSFIAVGALLIRFQGRHVQSAPTSQSLNAAGKPRMPGRIAESLRTAVQGQWAILIALILPSTLLFAGISLSGLFLNLVAIPWVGLVILPSISLGAAAPEPIGGILLSVADVNLGWLLTFLATADSYVPGWQPLPAVRSGLMILAVCICGAVLLLPSGVPGRALGWCLLPALLSAALPWQRARETGFELTVLDVGQGLAVVASTETHTMVFDTGPSSASGWSSGVSIVAPYVLNSSGQHLDLLAISHGDLDHSGGAEGVLAELEVAAIAAPGRFAERFRGEEPIHATSRCMTGQHIDLGELSVEWLWPRSDTISGEENDHSCVALLQWRGVRVLLTGDISADVEYQLAAENPDFPSVDLLIAPHHGSRTSTSMALIQWAAPERVAFSAGYRHHFGHPHPSVVQRLSSQGVALFNTADTGAVRFNWLPGAMSPHVYCARETGKFWRTTGPLAECD